MSFAVPKSDEGFVSKMVVFLDAGIDPVKASGEPYSGLDIFALFEGSYHRARVLRNIHYVMSTFVILICSSMHLLSAFIPLYIACMHPRANT